MQQHQFEKALLNLEKFCSYLGIGKTLEQEINIKNKQALNLLVYHR